MYLIQRTLEKETSLVASETVVSRRSTRTVVPKWSTRVSLSVSILTGVDGSFLSIQGAICLSKAHLSIQGAKPICSQKENKYIWLIEASRLQARAGRGQGRKEKEGGPGAGTKASRCFHSVIPRSMFHQMRERGQKEGEGKGGGTDRERGGRGRGRGRGRQKQMYPRFNGDIHDPV